MMKSTPAAQPRSASLWQVFVVTSLGAFLVSLDLSIVNVAFPALERAFATSNRAALAWVVTAYSIAFGSLLVIGGRTADRYGLRRVFFWGMLGFSIGSALCGIAPSVAHLIAGRVLQGIGAAFALPASVGLLLAAVPADKRSQTVALWGGVGALAVATGPSLGSVLVAGPGWRWAFYVNLPVCALAYLWGRRVLPNPAAVSGSGARPDYLGAVFLAAAVGAVTYAISEIGSGALGSTRVAIALGITPLLAAACIVRSARHPVPVLDLRLFGARSFSVANLATLIYAMGFFAMLLGNILFLTSVWHYPIQQAGLAVTPGPLVVALVSGFAGKFAARHGFRSVLLPGSLCFALGLLWFAGMVSTEPAFLTIWLPGTLLIGLGIGLTFPVLSAAAVSSLPSDRFGVGSAVNQTARQVGGAIGVTILIALLGEPSDPHAALSAFDRVWCFAAAMAGLSGAIGSLLGSPLSRPAEVAVVADAS
ncbi:MAG: DHA2 family efflux MFS transporter permease subunit [Polyangiales bacterium]